MVGQREVFGDLVVFAGVDHGQRDFQAIDGALLYSREGLAPGHGHGRTAHGIEHVDVHRVLHHAVFHAAHIGRVLHRLLVVDHVAKAAFHRCQGDDALGFQASGQLGTDFAIQHFVGLRLAGIQEGQVVELVARLDLRHDRIGHDGSVDGAKAQAFQHGLFIAELTVGEHLNFDAAFARRFHMGFESARRNGVRVLGAVGGGPAELDDGFVLGMHRTGAQPQKKGSDQCR